MASRRVLSETAIRPAARFQIFSAKRFSAETLADW